MILLAAAHAATPEPAEFLARCVEDVPVYEGARAFECAGARVLVMEGPGIAAHLAALEQAAWSRVGLSPADRAGPDGFVLHGSPVAAAHAQRPAPAGVVNVWVHGAVVPGALRVVACEAPPGSKATECGRWMTFFHVQTELPSQPPIRSFDFREAEWALPDGCTGGLLDDGTQRVACEDGTFLRAYAVAPPRSSSAAAAMLRGLHPPPADAVLSRDETVPCTLAGVAGSCRRVVGRRGDRPFVLLRALAPDGDQALVFTCDQPGEVVRPPCRDLVPG
ncbi:MAG: hypothetical protein ACOZNI_11560 [Myxococcota bacterium]